MLWTLKEKLDSFNEQLQFHRMLQQRVSKMNAYYDEFDTIKQHQQQILNVEYQNLSDKLK